MLGDGRQRKSYLYVQDCIDAMLRGDRATRDERVNIFNLGTDEYCEVNDSIGWITEHLGVAPALEYTGGDRGWIGDNPFIFLDTARIRVARLDARSCTIRDGVLRTLDYLQANPTAARDARMNVAVLGLWHLGSVTAACLRGRRARGPGVRSRP